MEYGDVLAKVQKLITLAEHPSTGENESKLARQQAHALMLKYAIDQAELDATRPAEFKAMPKSEEFLTTGDYELAPYMSQLAHHIARHTRCLIRDYTRYDKDEHVWISTVYGYESDVRYFSFLYTTLRLHMIGALRPEWDKGESMEANAYRLHNAGFNWLDMARMTGWKKMTSREIDHLGYRGDGSIWDVKEPWWDADENVEPSMRLGSRFKRAYRRECERRGEAYQIIAPGAATTYQKSAARGYADRIGKRLREAAEGAETSSALVLRMGDVEQMYREANASAYTRCPACGKLSTYNWQCDVCGNEDGMADPPPEAQECERCKVAAKEYWEGKRKSRFCRDHKPRAWKSAPYSGAGYAVGVATANTADLNRSAGSTPPRQIG